MTTLISILLLMSCGATKKADTTPANLSQRDTDNTNSTVANNVVGADNNSSSIISNFEGQSIFQVIDNIIKNEKLFDENDKRSFKDRESKEMFDQNVIPHIKQQLDEMAKKDPYFYGNFIDDLLQKEKQYIEANKGKQGENNYTLLIDLFFSNYSFWLRYLQADENDKEANKKLFSLMTRLSNVIHYKKFGEARNVYEDNIIEFFKKTGYYPAADFPVKIEEYGKEETVDMLSFAFHFNLDELATYLFENKNIDLNLKLPNGKLSVMYININRDIKIEKGSIYAKCLDALDEKTRNLVQNRADSNILKYYITNIPEGEKLTLDLFLKALPKIGNPTELISIRKEDIASIVANQKNEASTIPLIFFVFRYYGDSHNHFLIFLKEFYGINLDRIEYYPDIYETFYNFEGLKDQIREIYFETKYNGVDLKITLEEFMYIIYCLVFRENTDKSIENSCYTKHTLYKEYFSRKTYSTFGKLNEQIKNFKEKIEYIVSKFALIEKQTASEPKQ